MKLKITALLLCLWLLLCLVPAVSAAGLIEEKAVSLTISSQYDGTPLVGASFSLYRVAEVDERGELNAVPPFEAFDVETRGENDAVWMAVTAALTDYVLQEEVAPYATGVTDANGVLAFPAEGEALDKGLYLVMGDAHGQGEETYETTPFLVMLPSLDPVKNEWVYDVCVNAKHKPLPKDTVSYTVEKVWTDKDHENMRPEYITVTLLRNGEPYQTVRIYGPSWSHTWEGLDPDSVWSIAELDVTGYVSQIRQDGFTFVITNTYTPELPQTGQLDWPVPVMVVCGLCLFAAGYVLRRAGKKEHYEN